ncbi:MAG: MoxR family ATPase [Deltaproteobacteria bacterium]|nr:MoxR family ATPase [Deltaproteobacteria bacterium]
MTESQAGIEQEVQRFASDVERIADQVAQRVVGNREVVRLCLTALLARGHVLLEGVPGLGKTLLARTVAEALNLSFARVQFTPDLMPADITGTTMLFDGNAGRALTFVPGPVFTNILLADEINRGTPKTQSALLEAMQEGAVTVGRERHVIEAPFIVVATQNPIEMHGTYPLPEAELDRFLFKVSLPSPSADELHRILDLTTQTAATVALSALPRERVLAMQELVWQVPLAPSVKDFAVRLVQATHPERSHMAAVKQHVRYGVSPRGAQALVLGAKVKALCEGRATPSFVDVRAMLRPAFAHRLLLSFAGEAEGATVEGLLAQIEQQTPERV